MSVHLYTNLQRVDFADGYVSVYSTLTGKTWNIAVYKNGRPVDRRQRRSKEAAVRTAHELAKFWESDTPLANLSPRSSLDRSPEGIDCPANEYLGPV